MARMDERTRFAQAVELTTATYDQVASNYAERNETRPQHWTDRMEQFVDRLAQAAERHPIPELGRPGDDIALEEYLNYIPVLDAGCGPGRDSRALAAYGLPVLGIDLSQGMLDEAQERTARRLPTGSIRYALMDLRRLELPDACCRGVWCSASLLHVPRHVAPRAVSELARVALPGAPFVVFIKERAADREPERMEPYPFGEHQGQPRYYAYYTTDEARALLEGAGLTIDDLTTLPHSDGPQVPGWVSILAHKP